MAAQQRKDAVEARKTELARALDEVSRSEEVLLARKRVLLGHQEQSRAYLGSRPAAASAAELMADDEHQLGQRVREGELREALEAAQGGLREAQARAEEARAALAASSAEYAAIEKHHARFIEERAQEQQRRAEAEASDQTAARFSSPES